MAEWEWSAGHSVSGHFLLKWMLFFLNFFYWLLGGTSFLLGAYLFLVKERVLRQYVYFVFDPAIFFMVIGCVIFVVATCGCVGAARENLRLLCVYCSALSVVLVVAASTTVFVLLLPSFSAQVRRSIDDTLRRAVVHYRDDRNLEDLIDTLQSTLECCGMSRDGYLDWRANPYFNCSLWNYSRERCGVPYSCCKKTGLLPNVMCGYDTTDVAKGYKVPPKERIFTEGCQLALERLLKESRVLVAVLSMIMVGSLAVGAVGACMLTKWIKSLTTSQSQMIAGAQHFRPESQV